MLLCGYPPFVLRRELSCKLRALATDLVGHLDKLDLAEEEDEEGEGAGGGGGSGSGGKKGSKGSKGPALPSDPNAPTMPAAISDVVAPRGVACSINDASPLMVRLHKHAMGKSYCCC